MLCAPIYPLEAGSKPIRFWRDFLADKSDDVGQFTCGSDTRSFWTRLQHQHFIQPDAFVTQ